MLNAPMVLAALDSPPALAAPELASAIRVATADSIQVTEALDVASQSTSIGRRISVPTLEPARFIAAVSGSHTEASVTVPCDIRITTVTATDTGIVNPIQFSVPRYVKSPQEYPAGFSLC